MKRFILFSFVFLLTIPATSLIAQCADNEPFDYLTDNLLVNASFEDGNQGFNSGQKYFGECQGDDILQTPEFYSIPFAGASPSDCNKYWTPNLTANDGKRFMISDFPVTTVGVDIWCQELEIKPDYKYEFSGYFANVLNELYDDTDPVLRIHVKGPDYVPGIIYDSSNDFVLSEGKGWTKASTTFDASTNQKIVICIQNVNIGHGGNDIAFDNFSLRIVECNEPVVNEDDDETNETDTADTSEGFYDCDEMINDNSASLLNGSFEDGSYFLWENGASNYSETQVDFWYSASYSGNIDLLDSGHGGVFAYEGETYAEANSFDVSSIYQDIATVPGDILYYSFAHRGRDGQDMIGVFMGIPRPKPQGPTNAELVNTYTSDNDRWIMYEGKYEVPAGQTVTRFSLKAMKSTGGNLTTGNFIDAVTVQSIEASCENPMMGNVEICANGLDDDNDGLIDSDDPDCSTSGGNNGGLESNGRLAEKIFKRTLDRRIDPSQAKTKKSHMLKKERTASYGQFGQTNERSKMSVEEFIPLDTIANTETYISSPRDLEAITNATEVFSVDIFRNENRLAAIFASATQNGVYEHTKYICDRTKGGIINDLRTERIGYADFVIADIMQPEGNREYAISFSARETADGKIDVQSHWSLENYPSDEAYYNFQIWASDMDDLRMLTLKTLQLIHEYKSIQTMTTTGAPSVFVSEGEYSNGKLDLKLINKTASTSITIEGEKTPTETKGSEQVSQTASIQGHYSEYITIDVGSVYDMGFRIKHVNDTVFDDLFIADGLWFIDTKDGNLDYEVAPSIDEVTEDIYPIERSIAVNGTYDNTVNIYRSLKPNFRSVDVSNYNTLHFNVSGAQAMQIVLIKSSISEWDAQYKTSITTTGASNEINIPFSRFSNGTDEEINLSDVQAIIFKFENGTETKTLNTDISSLDFRNNVDTQAEDAFDNATMVVSPNPSKNNVSVKWLSDAEGMHSGAILDINGKVIREFEGLTSRGHNQINVERQNLTSGIYFISIIEQTGKILSEKIVLID